MDASTLFWIFAAGLDNALGWRHAGDDLSTLQVSPPNAK
jgi:hypothetical protein